MTEYSFSYGPDTRYRLVIHVDGTWAHSYRFTTKRDVSFINGSADPDDVLVLADMLDDEGRDKLADWLRKPKRWRLVSSVIPF